MAAAPGGEAAPEALEAYADWAVDTQVGTGRFQFIYIALLGLAYGLPSAHTYANVFVQMDGDAYQPPWSWHEDCGREAASCPELSESENCSVPLKRWVADASGRSIVADFTLVCSRGYRVPLLGSIYFAAFALGLLVCGQVSDTLGRKIGYLFSVSVMALGGFLAPLAEGWGVYALARGLLGFGVAGVGNTTFVWMTEYANPTLRPLMSWVPNVGFCLGQALPSALGFFIYGWRPLLLVTNLAAISGLLYAPCMRESPRWLALKGRSGGAYRVVCEMAECNGVPQPPPPPKARRPADGAAEAGSPPVGLLAVCAQLCGHTLGPRFLLVGLSWFSISFAFYGLGLFAPNLPFNAYAANALNALVAVPFYVVSQPLIGASWCGRKGAVVGGFLIGGTGLLLSTAIVSTVASMVVYYTANGALCLAFGVIYVWSSELFPTYMRGRVMSYASIFGRAGAILAPFVVEIGRRRPSLALVIFAVPCLVSGALGMQLPETRGRKLPSTLEDVAAESAADSDSSSDSDSDSSASSGRRGPPRGGEKQASAAPPLRPPLRSFSIS